VRGPAANLWLPKTAGIPRNGGIMDCKNQEKNQVENQEGNVPQFGETMTRAETALGRGRLVAAQLLYKEAIAIGIPVFGRDSNEVANATFSLAKVLKSRFRNRRITIDERVALQRRAVSLAMSYCRIREKLLAGQTLELSHLYQSLSFFVRDCSDYKLAIYLKRKELRFEAATGELTEYYVHSTGHVGLLYLYGLHDEYAAERIFKHCLKLCAKVHGNTKDTWDCWYLYEELAKIYQARSARLKALNPNKPKAKAN